MADFNNTYSPPGIGGALDAAIITPGDSTPLTPYARNFQITTDGTLTVTTAKGNKVTFPAGTFALQTPIPLAVQQVWATGTTATGIIGYF